MNVSAFEIAVFVALPLVVFGMSARSAFRALRTRRMLEDLPTSRTRSAHQGYVELAGIAELMDGPVIRAPMSLFNCVWWSLSTQRYNGKNWVSVDHETSDELFYIRDATGTCVVDPEGAQVTAGHRRVTRGKRGAGLAKRGEVRHTELYIKPGDELHIIGWFTTFTGVDNWDHDAELSERLRDWKRDQDSLLRRFDANRDGQIDAAEWAEARREARQELGREHRELSVQPGVNVIRVPDDGRPFLIAGEHEQIYAKRLNRQMTGYGLAAALSCTLALWMIASWL
ncbi:MAG: hypothetical protein AB8G17_02505 [Gammaproteobacteria bacterium]